MTMNLLRNIIRLGIGSMFIIAAFLKLWSIDEFEIYIYSFDIFNFITTTVLSRLLISGEMILGSFMIFNVYRRFTCFATLATECLFTLFLIFVTLFRDDSNCHCFGDMVELSPVESMVKNMVTMALLFFIMTKEESKHKAWLPATLCVLSLVVSFIVTPMDSLYNKIYSSEKEISTIDLHDAFDDIFKIDFTGDDMFVDSTMSLVPDKGKHLMVVVSSGCRYCQLGVRKLSLIMRNKEMDTDKVDVVIWGSYEGIMSFREMTDTQDYSYWHIMPRQAIDVTYGRFPMFIWMEGDSVVSAGDFRDIDDSLVL